MGLNMNLKNKRIMITGASTGLGAVASVHFSKQNCKLVICGRSQERLSDVKMMCFDSKNHLVLPFDLLKINEIEGYIQEAYKFLNNIDVVLHCAGGGIGIKDSLPSNKDILKLFNLNIGAAMEINRLVVPFMKEKKYGNLVHVGSIASREAVGSVGYNTVKSALNAYVRTLGKELASSGIIATGILPGGFIAEGNAMSRLRDKNPTAYENFIENRLPRKKMGLAEEILPILDVLCSENASMLGGCMLPIDAAEGVAY